MAKLTDKREKQLKKQAAKEQRKKDGTLGFFEKIFNKFKFTKKVNESNIKQAEINSKSTNPNVIYYKTKVETLQLKKAKKEAQKNKLNKWNKIRVSVNFRLSTNIVQI